jgi:hypothetical protein
MKRIRLGIHDLHPKRQINAQIFWIVFGALLLGKWLPRLAESWNAGETYNLPLGIAYVVIGLVVIVSGIAVVNATVSRLQSKIPSDPEQSETERTQISPPSALPHTGAKG